jgi:DNA-binding response OmpR family regulator
MAAASVLLIEDDEIFQELTSSYLRDQGYSVEIAADGELGLEAAANGEFDAIIVDLMMPRMHGFEVIQKLRESMATFRTPILVHSAKIYESDQRKALMLGANDFLQKPLKPADIHAAVERQLNAVRVTFWGVRGSIATPGRDTIRYGGNTPCVSIEHRGHTLVLDAGTGIRKLGLILQAEARGKALSVDLLVTHTHWDHIQGFPFFVPAYVPGNTVNVYGPRSLSKPLDKVLRGQMDPEYFPVALGDMAGNVNVTDVRDTFEVGPFTVRSEFMNHPGVTLGYRVEVAGNVIVYATDTEPFAGIFEHRDGDKEFGRKLDSRLIELVDNADVYIGDAQYTDEEYKGKVGWGHSACTDAMEVALAANVKRFVLFSHDPMQSDDLVDAKVEKCRGLALDRGSDLEVVGAAEGQTIALDPR